MVLSYGLTKKESFLVQRKDYYGNQDTQLKESILSLVKVRRVGALKAMCVF